MNFSIKKMKIRKKWKKMKKNKEKNLILSIFKENIY